MSLKVNLSESAIYDLASGAEECTDEQGRLHRPRDKADAGMADAHMESREHRAKFQDNEGQFAITLAPGDAPGAIRVEVQYEGPYKDSMSDQKRGELCVRGQNEILEIVSQWLKEMFGDAAGEWEVVVEDVPHPPFAVDEQRLRETMCTLDQTVKRQLSERRQDRETDREERVER